MRKEVSPSFIKRNPLPGSRSLECECRGLEELRRYQSQHGLRVPRVIALESDCLILEKIESVRPKPVDWTSLGEGLAKLHQVVSENFGFDEDNFIGLNPQVNMFSRDWGEFFFRHRLLFQVHLIKDSSLQDELLRLLNTCERSLIDFLNSHNPSPSLLHGDLWSGNVMFDSSGPWLIDPAVYYGDRECDLAMTKMFGGFSSELYSAYYAVHSLPEGHEKRFVIYNLYHYLNHYNLFGASYLHSVKDGFHCITTIA